MKQELMMWAVINNVTQKLIINHDKSPEIHGTRGYARFSCDYEKRHGNSNARVRKVKVTIEEAE
jgi:hypothetical protein